VAAQAIGTQMMIERYPATAPTSHRACPGPPGQQTSRRISLLRSQVYEITFAGQAGSVLRAEFDDCEVSIGEDTTTLRFEVPDQAALWGVLQRIMGFGLKLIELRLVAVPSAPSEDGNAGQGSSGA
jgi:hypothetical protein